MHYLYYPGCSLKATGRAYEESLLAVLRHLGIDVEELKDWSCCGATTYMGTDETQAFSLASRNLALAENQAETEEACLMAPCNACYLVLNKAQHYIEEYQAVGDRVRGALDAIGLQYQGTIPIRHPLDILLNDVGLQAIKEVGTQPLTGMKVACYYGCQIVRPYSTFDDQSNPTSMDRILRTLGAEVIDWSLKTRCCGGALTGTVPDAGLRLNHILLKEARRAGADIVATCCPLCQHNLECYQGKIEDRYGGGAGASIAYFTQLMGLAMGLGRGDLGLQRMLVPVPTPTATARSQA